MPAKLRALLLSVDPAQAPTSNAKPATNVTAEARGKWFLSYQNGKAFGDDVWFTALLAGPGMFPKA
jgi:hypothetical protein